MCAAVPNPWGGHLDGWRLIHWNKEAVTSLATLEAAYTKSRMETGSVSPKLKVVDAAAEKAKAERAERIRAADAKVDKEKADKVALRNKIIKIDGARNSYKAEIEKLKPEVHQR